MPVLITGAHRWLARRLALRLIGEGGEVRAYSDGDTSVLRAAGVMVASGTPDDEGRLDAALTDVHTLIHVGPGLLAHDPADIELEATVAARAAASAGVRRVITLSVPGAALDADDPVRRAKAVEESVIAAVPAPSVVVRSSLVDTAATRDALATARLVGAGPTVDDVEVAPVRPQDLVELLVAFDRARSRAREGHLLVAADGPVRTSVGRYLDPSPTGTTGRTSLVGRRLLDDARAERLHHVLRAGRWWTPPGDALDGWAFAEVVPEPPDSVAGA